MKTVLIVDDEIFTRDHLGRIIERRGFTVLTAATGEEGIALYKEHRPDLVFLDVLLPGIDGDYVFKYIREINPEAHVYLITGCDTIIGQEQALAMGAKGFLSKPIFVQDVIKVLETFGEPG